MSKHKKRDYGFISSRDVLQELEESLQLVRALEKLGISTKGSGIKEKTDDLISGLHPAPQCTEEWQMKISTIFKLSDQSCFFYVELFGEKEVYLFSTMEKAKTEWGEICKFNPECKLIRLTAG